MRSTPHSTRRSATRDYLVATAAGSTLAYAAWGLGGIPAWSLHVLLAGGVSTFLFAVVPWPKKGRRTKNEGRRVKNEGRRTEDEAQSTKHENRDPSSVLRPSPSNGKAVSPSAIRPSPSNGTAVSPSNGKAVSSSVLRPSSSNASRLLRWPPFWFSLAFLLYLLVGALNPAAEVLRDERGWWVEAVDAPLGVQWPTSVRADYQPMNAWRVLASFTAAFSLMWGLWAGVTRRKAILLTLWMFLLSGAGMGFVAILQHLTGAEAVLWAFPSSNENFWGSFFYRNQGAAFLNLVLVAAGVLFFYHAQKTRERARSGGPHFLCFLLFAAVATSVGLALSRGGILFASILSLTFLSLVAIYALQSLAHLSSLWAALIPIALLVFGAVMLVRYVDLEAIEQRFGDIGETIETAEQDARAISTQATWDMAQDRLWLGWGAGSFRYIFPMYQKNYPEIYHRYYHKGKQEWVGRKMYRYAHNDLVQFVAEYGLIGSGLLVLTFATILLPLLLNLRHSFFAISYLMLGFATSMSHAFLDFIFNSPAYWLAFVGLIAATAKLLRLEAERRSSVT